MGVRILYFLEKWELEYPASWVGKGGGNQSTLFSLRKWESGYPLWRVENICSRKSATDRGRNINLDHIIGHPSRLYWKLKRLSLRYKGIGRDGHHSKGPKAVDAMGEAPFSDVSSAISPDVQGLSTTC